MFFTSTTTEGREKRCFASGARQARRESVAPPSRLYAIGGGVPDELEVLETADGTEIPGASLRVEVHGLLVGAEYLEAQSVAVAKHSLLGRRLPEGEADAPAAVLGTHVDVLDVDQLLQQHGVEYDEEDYLAHDDFAVTV
ncbi:hypothetical protein MRX96_028585 [Rhipicephalus microplus]